MKLNSTSGNRRKPTAYRVDRGDSHSRGEFEAELLKNITDMNFRLGSAHSAVVSDHKHFSLAEAKGAAERLFAGLKLS